MGSGVRRATPLVQAMNAQHFAPHWVEAVFKVSVLNPVPVRVIRIVHRPIFATPYFGTARYKMSAYPIERAVGWITMVIVRVTPSITVAMQGRNGRTVVLKDKPVVRSVLNLGTTAFS